MMKTLAILLMLFHVSVSVIYRLNATDYYRMPLIYSMDNYDSCIDETTGEYCLVDAGLVSDEPSELLTMIQEYSQDTQKHFNHSFIVRGLCMKRSCGKFYNKTSDLKHVLEACLNESLWNEYQLKVKVQNKFYCNMFWEFYNDIDALDISVGIIIIVIVLMNVIGSSYDIFMVKDGKPGIKFLGYFSIKKNWKRLMAPSADGPEPRFRSLRPFNGLKVTMMFCVIIQHTISLGMIYVDNTKFVENLFDYPPALVALNGHLMIRIFFITSTFLLIYNLLIISEKRKLNWKYIPIGILYRFIRLTPTYALVLGWLMTWQRFISNGPGLQRFVLVETDDCRRNWWQHLLYINNYFKTTHCHIPSWYLAADTQLYCLALVLFLLYRSALYRKIVVCSLFIMGLIVPSLIMYFYDVDPLLFASPYLIHTLYHTSDSLELNYKPGHVHIISCAVGMGLGFIVYHCQQHNIDVKKYKNYRCLYWAIVPCLFLIVMSTNIFYMEGPRPSITTRILYYIIVVPLVNLGIAIVFWGMVMKYESVYRGIVQWHAWTALARVSYSAYLVHPVYIRFDAAAQSVLIHTSSLSILKYTCYIMIVSYGIATVLYLLVEAPFNQLLRLSRPDERPAKTNKHREEHNLEQNEAKCISLKDTIVDTELDDVETVTDFCLS